MDRNKILENIEEIFEICQDRNIGSNETELDIKETITDYIVKKLTLSDVSQYRELLLDFLNNIGRHDYETKTFKQIVDDYLKYNNCG